MLEKTPTKLLNLISGESIEKVAIPSNVRYGRAIYERGGVEILHISDFRAEGWAGGLRGKSAEGGGSRRRVTLTATSEGLKWHCTGNPKKHQIFCKHCVAVVLELINNP